MEDLRKSAMDADNKKQNMSKNGKFRRSATTILDGLRKGRDFSELGTPSESEGASASDAQK